MNQFRASANYRPHAACQPAEQARLGAICMKVATCSSLARLTQVLVGPHHPDALPILCLEGQPEVHAAHAVMQGLGLRGRARWRGGHAPLLQAPLLLLRGPWLSPSKLHVAAWLLRGLLSGGPPARLKPILLLLLLLLLPLLLLLKLT